MAEAAAVEGWRQRIFLSDISRLTGHRRQRASRAHNRRRRSGISNLADGRRPKKRRRLGVEHLFVVALWRRVARG